MWVYFDQQINKEYGKKFRQLQTSLRNDDNFELRYQLLTHEIEPYGVTKLSNE